MEATEQGGRRCAHCENLFDPENVVPVLIEGVQSFGGHLLTGKAGIREAYLCTICLPNLQGANVQGMRVEVDEERERRRGPIPKLLPLSEQERLDFARAVCSGVGACGDPDGKEDDARDLTHEVYDESARTTAYCYRHAERAYLFHLRRWRERQQGVR